MNRAPWSRYLLVASLALNLGIVTALVMRPLPPPPAALAVQPPHLNLQDYLDLTAEQRTLLEQFEATFGGDDARRHSPKSATFLDGVKGFWDRMVS